MCAVSMVGDFYGDKWKQHPWYVEPVTQVSYNLSEISRAEFDALKKEVEDMRQLLLRAKAYDEKTGQPDCEIESKVALLKEVAKAVGVSLDEVFKPPA